MGGIRPIIALVVALMVLVLQTMAYTPLLDEEQTPTRRLLTTTTPKTKKSQPKEAKPSVSKKKKDGKKQSKSSKKKPSSSRPSSSKPKKKKNKTRHASCNSKDILKLTWTLNMKTQFGTDKYTVPCGTTIVFDWSGEVHGVARIPSLKCPKDPKDYRIITGGRERIGAKATYKTTEVGELYFACQIYGHCQTGQLIQINVIPSKKEEKKKKKKKKKKVKKPPSNEPPPLPCSDAVCFCSTPVRKYGFQASPFDCQAFYQCSQSYGWLVRCPLGALYNAVSRQCDLDFKVDCSVGGWYGAARPRY